MNEGRGSSRRHSEAGNRKSGGSVRVKVPASASNLGPGFDCLGLALNLCNEVVLQTAGGFRKAGEPNVCVTVEGFGAGALPTGRGNLVVRAAERVFARARRIPDRLTVRTINRIPVYAGLGSSAAAIVGGLVAANELCNRPLKPKELLALAVEMEGHPDNVAPALLGGFTICVLGENGAVHVLQPRVRADLICVVCVPQKAVLTAAARRALPKTYRRRDAVFSLSRAAMLTAVLLGGDTRLLKIAMEDRLHQPYRSKFVPGMLEAIQAATAAGALGACFSGSGPAILAFVDRKASPEHVGNALERAFAAQRIRSETFVLSISRVGAHATKQ
jgi:homoserine kinase